MSLLKEFLNKMKSSDILGLTDLFDIDATLDDYCQSGMFNTETHLIGREAIDMYFSNRFIFQTYLFKNGELHDDSHGEMEVMIVGALKRVSVHLQEVTEDRKIKSLVINPL